MKFKNAESNRLLWLLFLMGLPVILGADKTQEKLEVFPACKEDGDLFACVQQVCEHVQEIMVPLNRPQQTLYVLDKDGGFDIKGIAPSDPTHPGGELAQIFVDKINQENIKKVDDTQNKLIRELVKQDPAFVAKENLPVLNFLVKLNFLVNQASIPNCGGMSSVVAGKLLAQPLFEKSEESINIVAGINKKTQVSHTFIEVPSQSIICDAWRPKEHKATTIQCRANTPTKMHPECKVYKPDFWDRDHGGKLKWPNTSHLKTKTQQFFRRKARELLTEINKQQRAGKQAYQDYIKEHMREEEITQPRF